jgi:glutathionylspermidine synthase
MQRHVIPPRNDWRDRARTLGFAYAEVAGEPYWDETACWEFTAAEIDVLDDSLSELERLSRLAAAEAVRRGSHAMLGIPEAVWPLLVRSWERQEPSLYGRMDLCWDGTGPPKLLEYNADTPTSLFESSVVQWEWLRCAYPDADQFNSIHEALIAAWPAMNLPHRVHFACMRDSEEDRGNVDYLRDTATQAGIDSPFLFIDEIGWNGRRFVDLARHEIQALFKLYPWEFLLRDEFGNNIAAAATTRWIEPAWRLLLSGKGILALLWEMFPGHPNLLPAFREPGRTSGPEIAKPLFGREGANITAPGVTTDGPYGGEGFVYQQWAPLPCVDGHYPVIGGWIIAGQPHGIGIREDTTPITRDTSRFLPHYFRSHP